MITFINAFPVLRMTVYTCWMRFSPVAQVKSGSEVKCKTVKSDTVITVSFFPKSLIQILLLTPVLDLTGA